MTPQEKKRLADLIGMLDSNQVGEREAELGKVHALRAKVGWPGFADLWRRVDNEISPEDFEKVEQALTQWQEAYDAKVNENAALRVRCSDLAGCLALMRAAFWTLGNWAKVLCAVVGLGVVGLFWSHKPASPPAMAATASADNFAFDELLNWTVWGSGDTRPVIVAINGKPWWVISRGSVETVAFARLRAGDVVIRNLSMPADSSSHVDARGNVHCLQLFAHEATRNGGAFLAPQPYQGGVLTWPERAALCLVPGDWGYKPERAIHEKHAHAVR